VRAALNYAFSTLEKPHVISLICRDNARSIRLALRVGEQLEGEAEALGTKFLVYGIDHETWSKIRT
jgi:RimJ/RimL family protein N-acetyltransferase